MDTGVIGSTSHNSRVAQLRKFVVNPPAHAHTLRLVVAGDGNETLGDWKREECEGHAEIADQVSELLEQHCETIEREVEAILGWERTNGGPVTKRLRAKPKVRAPSPTMLEDTAAAIAQITEGTQQTFLVQSMRQNEMFLRSYLQGHMYQLKQMHEQLQESREHAQLLGSQLNEAFVKNFELMSKTADQQAELMEARARIAQLEQDLAAATGAEPPEMPETDAARARLVDHAHEAMVKVAPEAWQLAKAFAWAQIQAAAQAKAAQPNGQANGQAPYVNGSNGHAAAE